MFLSQVRARYRRLAKSEQVRLVVAAKDGDSHAREQLVDAVMPLVIRIAAGLSRGNRRTYLLDLIQEGAVGVVRAVDRFNLDVGSGWTSYAANGAKLAMLSYLESTRLDDRAAYLKANLDGIVDVADVRPAPLDPDTTTHVIDTCRTARKQMSKRHSRGYEVIKQRLSGQSAGATSETMGVSRKRAYILMHKAMSPEISSRIASVVVCRETARHAIETLTSSSESNRV